MRYKSFVILFTGLSGAGKTTIAKIIREKLNARKIPSILLDGDFIRKKISPDLDFTDNDRFEHAYRTAKLAKKLTKSKKVILITMICPRNEMRVIIRQTLKPVKVIEVFCFSSVKTCLKRDPKNLYKKAFKGEIKRFPGIDDYYEIPSKVDIIINTEKTQIDKITNILSFLIFQKLHIEDRNL